MSSPTRSKISSRLCPVIVSPWLRRPTTARDGSGARAHEVGNRRRELHRAARIVDVGRDRAVDPAVHVQDRADLGVLAVDHPVLDRVDRHSPRLHVRRDAEHHHVARRGRSRAPAGCARRSCAGRPCRRRSRSSSTPARRARARRARPHRCSARSRCRTRGRRSRRAAAPGADRAAAGSPRAGTAPGTGRARRARGPRGASARSRRRRPAACSGRSATKSLAITSRDDASGSMPLEHVGDELGVGEPGTDAVGPLLECHEPHREPVGVSLTRTRQVREAAHEQWVAGAPQLVHVVRRLVRNFRLNCHSRTDAIGPALQLCACCAPAGLEVFQGGPFRAVLDFGKPLAFRSSSRPAVFVGGTSSSLLSDGAREGLLTGLPRCTTVVLALAAIRRS